MLELSDYVAEFIRDAKLLSFFKPLEPLAPEEPSKPELPAIVGTEPAWLSSLPTVGMAQKWQPWQPWQGCELPSEPVVDAYGTKFAIKSYKLPAVWGKLLVPVSNKSWGVSPLYEQYKSMLYGQYKSMVYGKYTNMDWGDEEFGGTVTFESTSGTFSNATTSPLVNKITLEDLKAMWDKLLNTPLYGGAVGDWGMGEKLHDAYKQVLPPEIEDDFWYMEPKNPPKQSEQCLKDTVVFMSNELKAKFLAVLPSPQAGIAGGPPPVFESPAPVLSPPPVPVAAPKPPGAITQVGTRLRHIRVR